MEDQGRRRQMIPDCFAFLCVVLQYKCDDQPKAAEYLLLSVSDRAGRLSVLMNKIPLK